MPSFEQYDSQDDMIHVSRTDNFHEADEQPQTEEDESHYEEDARSDMSASEPDQAQNKSRNPGVFKSLMHSNNAHNSSELRTSSQRDVKTELDKLYERCLDLVDNINYGKDNSEVKHQISELHLTATNFCEYNSSLTEELENLESIRLSLENEREATLQRLQETEARIGSECEMWKLKYKDAMEELEAAEQALYADKGKMPAAAERHANEEVSELRHKGKLLEESLRLITAEKNELQAAFNDLMAKMELANSIEPEHREETTCPAVYGDNTLNDVLADENERLKLEVAALRNERDELSQEVIRLTTESVQRREQANDLIQLATDKGDNTRKLVASEGFNVLIEKMSSPKKQMAQVAAVDIDPEPLTQVTSTASSTKMPNLKNLPSGIDVGQIEMELKKVGVNDASEIHLHIHQHGHKHKHVHNHAHSHSHLYNVKQSV